MCSSDLKTLKGFENIVVNPGYKISNRSIIDDCNITLRSNSKLYNNNGGYITGSNITSSGSSKIYNKNGGSINDGNITLSSNSEFYNSDSITGSNITLSDSSKFYNGAEGTANITGNSITLNKYSEFYNNSYILNNCIFINGSAKLCNFYNYKDNKGNITTTKYGTLKDNYIFADDTSTIQNSYDNKSGVFNNTYLRFSGSSNIDITEYQSLPADSFTLGKTIMSYLNKQFSELKKATTDKNNVNSLASQINTLNTNYSNLKKATTDKNNKDSFKNHVS